MKIRLSLVLFVLALFAAVWGVSVITGQASTEGARLEEIKRAVIAREQDSAKAWREKNKAFFEGFMADDATFFGPMNPYLETEPKKNFLPKFEQYAEMFKILDTQMYNPQVQVYGDIAILTYNSASTINMSGRVMNYTGKMTTVYRKQGDAWRVVHGHESVNAGAQ